MKIKIKIKNQSKSNEQKENFFEDMKNSMIKKDNAEKHSYKNQK